ncbi:hypothetical protein [Saccharibacillus endophyticus]|uniref:Uncharacterized protein n=1 Tax=Saccharibacillus endophyticus TaxID=2060666 RepID=A0ABQ1ZMP0_9BACL|nr:hypothetical protein [Saccharibacillus endophyticus]GGH69401.1 hypothetical protein GCM10007362_04430 [Saccharibacillus endophyticus]
MQFIGQKVEHASYGQGQIVHQEDQRIEVKFASEAETRKFMYPDAFEKFLSMNDPKSKTQVEQDVQRMHEGRREEREETERKWVESKEAEAAAKKAKKAPVRKKAVAKQA